MDIRRPSALIRALIVVLAVALAYPSGPASAQDLGVVRIVTIPTEASMDVYYARDKGFFKDAGLNVEISEVSTGAAGISGIVGGTYDISNTNLGSVAAARARGILVKLIAPASIYVKSRPNALLFVGKGSPIRSAQDLNGKTIAVVSIGSLSYVTTKVWLDKSGGDSKSVKFIGLPFPAMLPALEAGKVDAISSAEPFATSAKAAARVLADTLGAVSDSFLETGYAASDAWLAEHPSEAARFVVAMRRAHEWANRHQKETADILVHYGKLTPEVATTMTRSVFGTTLTPGSVQPFLDDAYKYGELQRPVNASEIIWSP